MRRLIIAVVVVFVMAGAVLVGLSAYPWRKTVAVQEATLLAPGRLMLTVDTCQMRPEVSVEETEFAVHVRVVASLSPFQSGGLVCLDSVEVLLKEPLGDRVLVDKHTGRAVEVEIIPAPTWAMLDYASTVCFAWDMMLADVDWSRSRVIGVLRKTTPPTVLRGFHHALVTGLSVLSHDYTVAMAKEAFATAQDYVELKVTLPCPLGDEPFIEVVEFGSGRCSRTLARSEYLMELVDKVPTLKEAAEAEGVSYHALNEPTDAPANPPSDGDTVYLNDTVHHVFVCPSTPYRDSRPLPKKAFETTS